MCLYVRDLTGPESMTLTRWLKDARSVVRMRRAQILAFSGQGMRVQEIAKNLCMHEEYVRELIRRFNDDGFDALKPRPRPGRPKVLSEEEKSVIAEIATAPPQAFGRPFNQWSLPKLHAFLLEKKLVRKVSLETMRSALKEQNVTFQRTRTWKRSNDPEYDSKKNESRRSTAKRRKGQR